MMDFLFNHHIVIFALGSLIGLYLIFYGMEQIKTTLLIFGFIFGTLSTLVTFNIIIAEFY